MSLLQWFNTKDVDEFADSIVAALRERVPPSGVGASAGKEMEKLRKSFGQLIARIDGFCQMHRMNLYTKARLGNRVKWALRDAGYSQTFVDTFTQEVVTHVALASRKRDK